MAVMGVNVSLSDVDVEVFTGVCFVEGSGGDLEVGAMVGGRPGAFVF